MAVPRAVRSFIGISRARSRNTRPRLENSRRWAWDDVWTTSSMRSSSFSFAPWTPRPPAALGPEGVGRHRLDVAGPAHGDDELLVVDQVLDVHVARDRG